MRGEQQELNYHAGMIEGSPPLARGTVATGQKLEYNDGITPACAGNRRQQLNIAIEGGDHPRLRGEQTFEPATTTRSLGSPPLARGTVASILFFILFVRITPACAGNRATLLHTVAKVRDHPRLRGEQICIISYAVVVGGSPPLARGTVFGA